MMIHPTTDSNTIPYSTTNTTMVSGNIGQHETIQNKTASKDNDTQQDDSLTSLDKQYSVRDICMVAQTSKCLHFHTARIQKISVNICNTVSESIGRQGNVA